MIDGSVTIQSESAAHYSAVRHLHLRAFPTTAEADLVDRLRADDDAMISLVALMDGEIVGHIMLSRMTAPFPALGLAPIAVLPHWRKQGIAARLIEEGIYQGREGGWDAIFVLGDPSYYRRFGFTTEAAAHFKSPYAGPHLMALVLRAGGLPAQSGRVEYAPAFAALD